MLQDFPLFYRLLLPGRCRSLVLRAIVDLDRATHLSNSHFAIPSSPLRRRFGRSSFVLILSGRRVIIVTGLDTRLVSLCPSWLRLVIKIAVVLTILLRVTLLWLLIQ